MLTTSSSPYILVCVSIDCKACRFHTIGPPPSDNRKGKSSAWTESEDSVTSDQSVGRSAVKTLLHVVH
eukprot:scaffold254346_cov19-Prasinocladus_malaysianus.AAC.1